MIWGMTIHPGQELTREVLCEEHLTLASLECRISKYEGKNRPNACLLLKSNMREHVICTLEKGVISQQCLDLIFEQGEKITFATEGTGIVYLTGYTSSVQEPVQDEMQRNRTADDLIRDEDDEEGDDEDHENVPDNQDVEVIIKQEYDSEDGTHDSQQDGGNMDNNEPSTKGNSGLEDGDDITDCHHYGRGNGDVGGTHGSQSSVRSLGSSSCHGDDGDSDVNTGSNGDSKDDSGDSDCHGDSIHDNGIHGDGSCCDHIGDHEVHFDVAGIDSDGERIHDRDGNKNMDNLDRHKQPVIGDKGGVCMSRGTEGTFDHQEGDTDKKIYNLFQERQEEFSSLVSGGMEGLLPVIPRASCERVNWKNSSRLETFRRFNKYVRKIKRGFINSSCNRCKNCPKTLFKKGLHQTLRGKCMVELECERKQHWKKYGKLLKLISGYSGKTVDYICGSEDFRMYPLHVEHCSSYNFKRHETKVFKPLKMKGRNFERFMSNSFRRKGYAAMNKMKVNCYPLK